MVDEVLGVVVSVMVGAIGKVMVDAFSTKNSRCTAVTNQSSTSVVVTVDGQKQTIDPGGKKRFKVKQASPIRIQVQFPKSEGSSVEDTREDYDHQDWTVTDWGNGGLRLMTMDGLESKE